VSSVFFAQAGEPLASAVVLRMTASVSFGGLVDKRFYFLCRRCNWWFQASEKSDCPQCGSRDVKAKKVDSARPKRDERRRKR
jgi:rRNA maturation endonuclease Nob1